MMRRREFLIRLGALAPALTGGSWLVNESYGSGAGESDGSVRLFLGGDVMTGRGIDQILRRPSDPQLHEPYVKDATRYLELAEQANGPIPRPVAPDYPWGDGLASLQRARPDVRIINLETSITECDEHWPAKSVHYRMHPDNIGCLGAAGIDCCVLANNHVMDWGHAGLAETLATLDSKGFKTAGAGPDIATAAAPAILDVAGRARILVFACGLVTSGIPSSWAATEERAGVNLLTDTSDRSVRRLAEAIDGVRRQGDVVVLSIHWGANWGYDIPRDQRAFAQGLIDVAGVDLVHGHSSHHPKGIEVYRDRLILYGCGDLLNDYEGISGYEEFRDDLALMYFADVDPGTGALAGLSLAPVQIRKFRLNRPAGADVRWLRDRMNRECGRFGLRVLQDEGQPAVFRLADGRTGAG